MISGGDTAGSATAAGATALNLQTPTFTRATSAFDPVSASVVAVNARRRRTWTIGGRSFLADLIEGSRTNLLTAGGSEHFEVAGLWAQTGLLSRTYGATAPDGTATAATIIEDSSTGVHRLLAATITKAASALAYSYVIYAKPSTGSRSLMMEAYNAAFSAGASAVYTLTGAGSVSGLTGAFTAKTTSIEALPSGYYRCVLMFTTDTDTSLKVFSDLWNGSNSYAGDGTSGLLFAWASVELGAFPSSYISNRNMSLATETFGSSWTQTDTTVTSNTTADPLTGNTTGDTLTEGSAGTASLGLSPTIIANATLTWSVYAKMGNCQWMRLVMNNGAGTDFASGWFDLQNGVVGAVSNGGLGSGSVISMVNAGGGWYRCILTGAINGGTTALNYRSMSASANSSTVRVNSATRIQFGAQLEYGTAATPYWANTTAVGLRAADSLTSDVSGITDPRTNRLIWSEQFDNANWSKTDTTITANNLADPNGNLYADLATEGTLGTAAILQNATITAGASVVMSVHLKLGNCNILKVQFGNGSDIVRGWFNVNTGAALSAANAGTASGAAVSIVSMGSGWYRCILSGVVNAGSTTITCSTNSASADGSTTRVNSATYNIWGAQAEQATTVGAYLATGSVAVSAAQTGLNTTNGTVTTVLLPYGWVTDQDGGTSNWNVIRDGAGTGFWITRASANRASSAGVAQSIGYTPTPGATNKTLSVTWDASAVKEYDAGVVGTPTTSLAAPFATVTSVVIGASNSATLHMHSWVLALYWSRTLNASEELGFYQAVPRT